MIYCVFLEMAENHRHTAGFGGIYPMIASSSSAYLSSLALPMPLID